jgi:hypothetical protein
MHWHVNSELYFKYRTQSEVILKIGCPRLYTHYAVGWKNEELCVNCQQKQQNVLFFKIYRLSLGSTQPPVLWVMKALSWG